MKKKLIIILLMTMLVFATLGMLVGCEQGPQGPIGPQGPQGEQGIPGQDGQPGQDAPTQELNRIYQLGETFTFVNGNLELFSIRVERALPVSIYIYIQPSHGNSCA